MVAWHEKTAKEALEVLETSAARGLTRAEAARRLERCGPNELSRRPPGRLLPRVLGRV